MKQISFNFSGKNVLVTGCLGQLGQALSGEYMKAGARVIGFDVIDSPEERHLNNLSSYMKVDTTNAREVADAFTAIKKRIGIVNILINNAAKQVFGNYSTRKESDFDKIIEVNLKGSFQCISQFATQDLSNSEDYNIVNIASVYGIVSPDFRIYEAGDRYSSEVYAASKSGLIGMSRYFAAALANNGIRVNSVSPGGIYNSATPQSPSFIARYSDRVPMRRMARSEEVIEPVMFISSTAASYITGHNLVIDGGLTSW